MSARKRRRPGLGGLARSRTERGRFYRASCWSKNLYDSALKAEIALSLLREKYQDDTLYSYQCAFFPEHYHLGHDPRPETLALIERERARRDGLRSLETSTPESRDRPDGEAEEARHRGRDVLTRSLTTSSPSVGATVAVAAG